MKRIWIYFIILLGAPFFQNCKDFVVIDPPSTDLINSTVFSDDATATAAVIEIYAMLTNGTSFTNGGISTSFSYRGGLSADEFEIYSLSTDDLAFADNRLLPVNDILNTSFWYAPYQQIYRCNAVLDGLSNSKRLTPRVSNRLQGEAKFLRAFSYFYLVNMFGDVPLVLTTDYRINSNIARAPLHEVYQQIIKDLAEAVDLLDKRYLTAANTNSLERTRVNKYSAMALLSRVYLFIEDWQNAEALSTTIIDEQSLYNLVPLTDVFLKNSNEAIWQLVNDYGNTNDAKAFIFSNLPSNGALKEEFIQSFESNDQRKELWIGSTTQGSGKYYFPYKYKNTELVPITEYSMILRLSEQYLIRAEARINQEGKIPLGISDINVLRERASLPSPNNLLPLAPDLSKDEALTALEMERRHELFTELGHRWLDLKRWPSIQFPGDSTLNRADDILRSIKPGWKKEWKLYPIPQIQILNNPAMTNAQNPGYN